MRTLGQPAMEEKCHVRFNCWGQRKETGRKTKSQSRTVRWSWGRREPVAVLVTAPMSLWVPGTILKLDPPRQRPDRRCQEAQHSSLPLCQLGPRWAHGSKVQSWYYRPGRKCNRVTVLTCLFTWFSVVNGAWCDEFLKQGAHLPKWRTWVY